MTRKLPNLHKWQWGVLSGLFLSAAYQGISFTVDTLATERQISRKSFFENYEIRGSCDTVNGEIRLHDYIDYRNGQPKTALTLSAPITHTTNYQIHARPVSLARTGQPLAPGYHISMFHDVCTLWNFDNGKEAAVPRRYIDRTSFERAFSGDPKYHPEVPPKLRSALILADR